MQRSLKELKQECIDRGLAVCIVPPPKFGKRDYIKVLANNSIEKLGGKAALSWGMRKRLEFESPMLCFAYKHLKPAEKQVCMESDRWIADRKIDGCRMIVTYHPDEGFGFFSRNISVVNYLPVEYTEKILIRMDGKLLQARDFIGKFKVSFILDAEAVCNSSEIDTTVYRGKAGTVTGAPLNAATAILSINTADSHRIQKEQAQLELVVFDILLLEKRQLWTEALFTRNIWRDRLVKKLQKRCLGIGIVDSVVEDKQEFYEQAIAEGGEGIVLKNLDSCYTPSTSRLRTGFVKRKRAMDEAAGADIDAFITGFVPSNPKKSWSHLIGALELSVFIIDENGESVETVIAAVSSMPLKLREEMTEIGEDGMPQLKKEYYNKVLVINGQDISPKSLRFMHAVADWKRGFRVDKTHLDCEMEEKFLHSQVL